MKNFYFLPFKKACDFLYSLRTTRETKIRSLLEIISFKILVMFEKKTTKNDKTDKNTVVSSHVP